MLKRYKNITLIPLAPCSMLETRTAHKKVLFLDGLIAFTQQCCVVGGAVPTLITMIVGH